DHASVLGQRHKAANGVRAAHAQRPHIRTHHRRALMNATNHVAEKVTAARHKSAPRKPFAENKLPPRHRPNGGIMSPKMHSEKNAGRHKSTRQKSSRPKARGSFHDGVGRQATIYVAKNVISRHNSTRQNQEAHVSNMNFFSALATHFDQLA